MQTFSPRACAALGHYVYALYENKDAPFPFYVGKGQGNRVFAHARDKRLQQEKSDVLPLKLETIRRLPAGSVVYRFVAVNLPDKETAHKVEAAVIDALEQANPHGLTNEVAGHGGLMGMPECAAFVSNLNGPPLTGAHQVLLLQASKSLGALKRARAHEFEFTEDEVFAAVRGDWKLSTVKLPHIECCLAVYKQTVVGVFVPTEWEDAPGGKLRMAGRADAADYAHLMWSKVDSHMLPARTNRAYWPRFN